jgi:hypothetical protein
MATEKQIAANRLNALKSTGPRTAAGKANSSRNHTLTGLFARDLVLQAIEDPAEFNELLAGLLVDFQPSDTHQHILVTRYARQLWLAQRIARIECSATQAQLDEAMHSFWGNQPLPDDPAEQHEIGGRTLAETWNADNTQGRNLARVQVHSALLERQISRTLRELRLEFPKNVNSNIEADLAA